MRIVRTATARDDATIGRAPSEASRVETLCDTLGVNLVVSDSFARRCRDPLRDLGSFELRGVTGPVRLWAPKDQQACCSDAAAGHPT